MAKSLVETIDYRRNLRLDAAKECIQSLHAVHVIAEKPPEALDENPCSLSIKHALLAQTACLVRTISAEP